MKDFQVIIDTKDKGAPSLHLEEVVKAEDPLSAIKHVLKTRGLNFPDLETASVKEKIQEKMRRFKRLNQEC